MGSSYVARGKFRARIARARALRAAASSARRCPSVRGDGAVQW